MIQTERLLIQPLSDADENEILTIFRDENVQKTYMLPDFQSEEAMKNLFLRLVALSRAENHFVRGIYLENTLIGFLNVPLVEDDVLETDQLAQTVNRCRADITSLLETKSPGIDQGGNSGVESAMALTVYLLGRAEDLGEELVCAHRVVVVDMRDDGLLIERRQGIVYCLHGCHDLRLQVGIVLIGDGIERAKDLALLGPEGGLVLADDDKASYDKE